MEQIFRLAFEPKLVRLMQEIQSGRVIDTVVSLDGQAYSVRAYSVGNGIRVDVKEAECMMPLEPIWGVFEF